MREICTESDEFNSRVPFVRACFSPTQAGAQDLAAFSLPGEALDTVSSNPHLTPMGHPTFLELQRHPSLNSYQMCTIPDDRRQQSGVVTCPHSGSDCMGVSPGFAAYELCDFGQVISL